jgi:hypothetical protein
MAKRGGNISPATQFKPGQSGNPKGRAKKLPALDILLAEILGEDETGKSQASKILESIKQKAIKGDVKAAELLLNRAYGKPKDNEGAPTEMVIRVQRSS